MIPASPRIVIISVEFSIRDLNFSSLFRKASSASLRWVISLIILDIPMILLSESSKGDRVMLTSISLPFLCIFIRSKPLVLLPEITSFLILLSSVCIRFGTTTSKRFFSANSSSFHPNILSALLFHESILSCVSVTTMASLALSKRFLYFSSARYRILCSAIASFS